MGFGWVIVGVTRVFYIVVFTSVLSKIFKRILVTFLVIVNFGRIVCFEGLVVRGYFRLYIRIIVCLI